MTAAPTRRPVIARPIGRAFGRIVLWAAVASPASPQAGTAVPASPQQAPYHLAVGPKTILWGHFSADAPPVLRVKSGDVVVIETAGGDPPAMVAAGAKRSDIRPAMWDIWNQVTDKGPAHQVLTGPVYVDGAEPGDVLEVRIQHIDLAIPVAYNTIRPGEGFLPDEFPYEHLKIIPLDRDRGVARVAPGVEVPIAPFFGTMAVAPPASLGRVGSGPPWFFGGNIDNKEMTAGSTLYLPVQVPGALFFVGDGHAGEGNGEVDLSAMETSLTGTFQFVIRKDMHLLWPRGETPTHYVIMGFNEDLTEAARMAVRQAIDFLVTEKHMTRHDAYALVSVACDVDVTQVVDVTKGVHVLIPKAIFTHGSTR